jgi:hypothetical protein
MNRLIRSILAAGAAAVALTALPTLADQGRTHEHPTYTQAPTQLAHWRHRDHERARFHKDHDRASRNEHRRWDHRNRDGHGRWHR